MFVCGTGAPVTPNARPSFLHSAQRAIGYWDAVHDPWLIRARVAALCGSGAASHSVAMSPLAT